MDLQRVRNAGLAGAVAFVGICLAAGGLSLIRAGRPQDSGLGRLDTKEPIPYFIADGKGKTGYRASDQELALWALQAWQRAAGGNLRFVPTSESKALVRIYWAEPGDDQFGETRPLRLVDGRRG